MHTLHQEELTVPDKICWTRKSWIVVACVPKSFKSVVFRFEIVQNEMVKKHQNERLGNKF